MAADFPNCWYPCAGVQWVHLSQQNKWNRNSTALCFLHLELILLWHHLNHLILFFLGFSTRSGSYGFRGKKINDDQSNWGLKGWLFGHKGTPRRNDSFEDYKVSGAIQVNIWCNVICYCFILCLDAYSSILLQKLNYQSIPTCLLCVTITFSGNMHDPPSMSISFSSTILVSAAVISLR